jgi:copper(I)-binding protein
MQKKTYILLSITVIALIAAFVLWTKDAPDHHMSKPITHNQLKITDAYARASSPTAKVGAIFFTIENGTDKQAHLTGAKSDVAMKVELHTHEESGDGVMSMMQIDGGVYVDAGQHSMFKRGGNHVMLMGLNQSLKTGDEILIELIFDGQPMPLTVVVDNERKAQMAH